MHLYRPNLQTAVENQAKPTIANRPFFMICFLTFKFPYVAYNICVIFPHYLPVVDKQPVGNPYQLLFYGICKTNETNDSKRVGSIACFFADSRNPEGSGTGYRTYCPGNG
jgi:hypothetical protein